MNELQLIKSENFGEIEADIYSNGSEMFMTINQLAACLEYASGDALSSLISRNSYIKENEFSVTCKLQGTDGKTYNTRIFTEDGIYEVTMLSNQPKAKEFRSWIRKVLKALRHGNGVSFAPNPLAESEAEAKLNNSRARVSSLWMKLSDKVNIPEYKQICACYASKALAGHEVIPLPEATEHYYSATEIGSMLGTTKQRIGKIANLNNLKTSEYGKLFLDKSPYSPKEIEAFRYNGKAVEQFKRLLEI